MAKSVSSRKAVTPRTIQRRARAKALLTKQLVESLQVVTDSLKDKILEFDGKLSRLENEARSYNNRILAMEGDLCVMRAKLNFLNETFTVDQIRSATIRMGQMEAKMAEIRDYVRQEMRKGGNG